MRKRIYQLRILHDYSPTAQYVTLSLGVASVIPNQELTSKFLIKAADDALYEAKKQGRNRVIINSINSDKRANP
ncbi:diguanylate cyclase domain-containing protein [Thermodesulfobacteriota bacterium]